MSTAEGPMLALTTSSLPSSSPGSAEPVTSPDPRAPAPETTSDAPADGSSPGSSSMIDAFSTPISLVTNPRHVSSSCSGSRVLVSA